MGQKIYTILETILCSIIRWLFRLFHKEITEEQLEGFIQFVKFGIVGLSNTAINYLIYTVFLLLLRKFEVGGMDYLIAQIIAFVLSVLWSFFWNNKYVFTVKEGQQRNWLRALIKTYISYSFTGLFLNSILLVLWVQVFHISEFIAPIINLLVSVPLNFLINKFWAFQNE